MESNLAPAASRDNCATEQAKNELCIVLRCYRIRGTLMDALAMVTNGAGYVRQDRDFVLVCSEAYEQGDVS